MNVTQAQDRITMLLGPTASDLADAVLAVQSFLDADERKNEYILLLALRELVSNAVEHGNKRGKDLTATVTLERLAPGRFQLVVQDEGSGFDHRSLDRSVPQGTSRTDRRGLPLVHSLADELRFNDTGNQATALLALPQKTVFHLDMDGDWQVIRPNKDISGEAAEDFRTVLLELVEQGRGKYRFDLGTVTEIDSISLSIFVVFNNMLNKRGIEPELEIVGASPDISRLFHMTRLSRIYRIAEQGA